MRRLGLFIATCGYIGYAPVAPGTFGSAAGLVVFAAVRSSGSPAVEAAVIVILFLIGVWSATVEAQITASTPRPFARQIGRVFAGGRADRIRDERRCARRHRQFRLRGGRGAG